MKGYLFGKLKLDVEVGGLGFAYCLALLCEFVDSRCVLRVLLPRLY